MEKKPIPGSYRVSKRVFAGEHPLFNGYGTSLSGSLEQLLTFGITDLLDLTLSYEAPQYEALLPANVHRISFPIRNCDVPSSVESVVVLFRQIERLFRERPDAKLYIHCHGGVGRTGTIVACYYIHFEHLTFDKALARMRERFADSIRSKSMDAPETRGQVAFIRAFADTWLRFGTQPEAGA